MAMVFLKIRRACLLLAMALGMSGCGNLLFYPSPVMVRTPLEVGIQYDDVFFRSADGILLHGWYLPAVGPAQGTVLFAHGNAENISTHLAAVYWLPEKGYNVFLFDYRGYGQSQGTPSLHGAIEDFQGALRTVLARSGVAQGPVIVFGQSLGGAIAFYGSATSKLKGSIDALVVESTFASYRDVAQDKFAGFFLTWPLQWPLARLIPDDVSPIGVVQQLPHIPLLVIHGDADRIVPIKFGKALYAAAHEPKTFWEIPNGHHTQAFRTQANREKLVNYLHQVLAH